MKHVGCGGEIVETVDVVYDYMDNLGVTECHPALICKKCGDEIIGDSQIEDINF